VTCCCAEEVRSRLSSCEQQGDHHFCFLCFWSWIS
jgi:hypothetical protein